MTGHAEPAPAGSLLLVGTDKGLFRFRCDAGGATFVDGPHLAGYHVQHVVSAPGRPRHLLAAVDHPVGGSHLRRSDDGGANWSSCDGMPRHPPGRHRESMKSFWYLAWSPDGHCLYAGVDPAGLFISPDGGFTWRDEGPMPEAEKQKLAGIIERAHEQGRRVRFWGAPDHRDFWQMLLAARVDLINTDDLAGLQRFLTTP